MLVAGASAIWAAGPGGAGRTCRITLERGTTAGAFGRGEICGKIYLEMYRSNERHLAGTGPAACVCRSTRLSVAMAAWCSGCSEETRKVKRSRRSLSLPQTGHLAMLELVGSLSAAFLSDTAELIVGLLFAAGLVGCAVQGRDCEHSASPPLAR